MASAYDSQLKWEKCVYYFWNKDIFLKETHEFATGGLYSPPEPCEASIIMDVHALFDVFWTME